MPGTIDQAKYPRLNTRRAPFTTILFNHVTFNSFWIFALKPVDKGSSYPLSMEFLFAAGGYYRDTQLVKNVESNWPYGSQLQDDIYDATSTPKI